MYALGSLSSGLRISPCSGLRGPRGTSLIRVLPRTADDMPRPSPLSIPLSVPLSVPLSIGETRDGDKNPGEIARVGNNGALIGLVGICSTTMTGTVLHCPPSLAVLPALFKGVPEESMLFALLLLREDDALDTFFSALFNMTLSRIPNELLFPPTADTTGLRTDPSSSTMDSPFSLSSILNVYRELERLALLTLIGSCAVVNWLERALRPGMSRYSSPAISSPIMDALRVPRRVDELWSKFRDPQADTMSEPYTALGTPEPGGSVWLDPDEFLLPCDIVWGVTPPAVWFVSEVMFVPVRILKLGPPGVRAGGRGKIGGGSGNSSGCTLTYVSPLSSTYIECGCISSLAVGFGRGIGPSPSLRLLPGLRTNSGVRAGLADPNLVLRNASPILASWTLLASALAHVSALSGG